MQSQPLPLRMKRRSILSLCALSVLPLTSCASSAQTVLAPIPVDPVLRQPCEEAVQPADPVTASALALFGLAAATEARCWKTIATGALGTIDAHNEAAAESER